MTDGDLIGLSQPSVCRIVARVSTSIAIASKKKHLIQFPLETERLVIKQQFKNVGGIPGVVGCIDCSHIPISSPGGENANIFRNRKGYFSVNVQAVCDPSLRFINLVCRWPGSTHDSRIFDNSALCAMLENNEIEGILLGDGDYACRHYMLTPLHNPTTSKEKKYNQAHIKTRGKVERMFGVWKQRFRCLRIPLRMRLQKSLTVIVATACLHNFAINNGDFLEEELEELINPSTGSNAAHATISGNIMRQQIVDKFFN